jgi:transcriptional regulator with XRE-family HTH domain
MDRFVLQALMGALKLRQPAFARRIGISQGQLSKVLNGKHELGPDTAAIALRIAEAEAPDIATRARLLKDVVDAYHASEEFRKLVAAAIAIMRSNA